MEEIKGLTRERIEGMIRLQNQYYAMMAEQRRLKAVEDAKTTRFTMVVIAVVVALLFLLSYINRPPTMYIEESACLKYEKTDTLSLVGVGPNPLKWTVSHNPCIEFAEPTLRINPDYLEWAASERASEAANAYYEDEEEY